ncbi:hypothetical protein JCM10213v2_002366 [Rhodosporidiobolus nylandii]
MGGLPSQGSTRSLSSQGVGQGQPQTIAGEPLHDMGRAVALLKSSKFYAEGFLMKRVEAGSDGKAPSGPEGHWAKYFVQLSGTTMSTWNAAEMEDAAKNGSTVPPQYLNLQDAFVHPFPPHARGPKTPTQFQFALNCAGLNRILFCAPTFQALTMWINAIRLSTWERSRCLEIYTGSLLGLREPRVQNGWPGYDAGLPVPGGKGSGRFEGWLNVRFPGDTDWRRVWTVVQRGTNVPTRQSLVGGPMPNPAVAAVQQEEDKRSRRSSLLSFGKKKDKHMSTPAASVNGEPLHIDGLPGDGAVSTVAFWERQPAGKKAEPPLCIAQHVFYAAAIFPETEALVDRSAIFKIEGTFLNPQDGYRSGWGVGGRAEKQGYALLMLEEGGAMAMLQWIVGLADVFKLYGRPRNFSYDPRDPSSLYFALPIGPHRDRQFLDRELVDNFDINESRPRAIRAIFHNQLFERMRMPRPPPSNGNSGPPSIPSQEARASSSLNGSAPTSPIDGQETARRWSQVPQSPSRDDSPRLPPVLASIGEGSFLDEQQQGGPNAVTTDAPPPQSTATPVEPRGVDARRMSIHRQATADREYSAPPPEQQQQQQQQPVASPCSTAEPDAAASNNYLGDIGLRRASQGNSSAEGDLSAYTAYLSSDIARERTPPLPTAASQTQQRSYSNSPRPGLQPIHTTQASASQTPLSPAQSSAPQDKLATPHSEMGRSDLTHLTYAVPGSTAGQQRFEPPMSHQLSPVYSRAPPSNHRLPSPGAASGLETPQDENRPPPSPGLAYLADSPVPEQHAFAFSNGEPRSSVSPQQYQQDFTASPPPVPAAIPVPARAPLAQKEQPFSPPFAAGEAQPLRSQGSNHSLGTSVSQMHNGKVVDSPEDLPLPSPKDGERGAFSTQPLFGGAGSPRPSHQPQASAQTTVTERVEPVDGERRRTEDAEDTVPRQREQQQPKSANDSYAVPEDMNIHQDLLAALNFVDRSGSPDHEHSSTPASPSSVEPSPMPNTKGFHVGPPKRGMFEPTSPDASDEQYGFNHPPPPIPEVETLAPGRETKQSSARTSASSTPAPPAFPSSFAKNKRDERAAAAQLAQQAKEQALMRPGRAAGAPKKKKVWVDSDEEEEEEEVDESSDEEELPARRVQHSSSSHSLAPSPANHSRGTSPNPLSSSMELPPPVVPQQRGGRSPQRSPNVVAAARQSYLHHGPGYQNYSNPNSAPPASPTREAYSSFPPAEGHAHRKPALNPHGLLATGMLEKEERSARAQEYAARDVGQTLLSLPAKPPPPQTGLVGALTSHQREKERTGGVGRALTEQQRERKLAEQRQKQLDDMQRQQLAMYQQQMQMAQFGGGFGGMGMGSMGYAGSNPWMMGGMPGMFGGFPGAGSQIGVPPASPLQPQGTGNGMDPAAQAMFQQQQMMAAQQAAQAAAQQAYMAAMQQFSPPPASSPPGGSPSLGPIGYPSMSAMPSMPSMPFMAGGMMGSPSFAGGFGAFGHGQQPSMSMYAGSQFGGAVPQQPTHDGQVRSGHASADNSDNEAARAMSPLDLHAGRRNGTE